MAATGCVVASSQEHMSEHKADSLNARLSFMGGMDDVPNLFIIGCTNFKAALDPAFLR